MALDRDPAARTTGPVLAPARRALAAMGMGAVLAAGLAGCGSGGDRASEPAPTTRPPRSSTTTTQATVPPLAPGMRLVAEAVVPQVAVFDDPGAPKPSRTLANPTPTPAPLVFLVEERRPDGWLEVDLPIRPNGSTGWIRAETVSLAQTGYRVVVELGAHRLTLYDRDRTVVQVPVGVGVSETPTPGGVYYIKELLRPPDPGGAYGPYAYGLSGFSNVLTSFGGGDGVIGIHGTDDPSSIGRDVSHGCIRIGNDVITRLVETIGLPLGTPVEIRS